MTRPRAEIGFHIGLATVVLPVVSLPIVWGLAIQNLRAAGEDAVERRWSRRLLGLAILDTFVAAALVTGIVTGMISEAPREQPRIGVVLDEREGHVEVRDVFPGSPAEAAGMEAGDTVVRARGRAVSRRTELLTEVERGEPLELEIERSGARSTVRVTPSRDFVPSREARCSPSPFDTLRASSAWELAPYAVFLTVAGVFWVIGRRRGVRQWTVWPVLVGVLLLVSVIGGVASAFACAVGMRALESTTLGLVASEVAMAAIGLVWLRLAKPPELADERPRWPFGRTYGTALLYAVAWIPRVGWLSIPLVWASRQLGLGEVSPELEQILGAGLDEPLTAALTFTGAAVLAPIAEEVLFRGIVMPHLSRAMSPWAALYASSLLFGVLHVAHGVMFIGPLVLGVILGWARLRSRGLWAPIALHMTFNGTATLVSYLS